MNLTKIKMQNIAIAYIAIAIVNTYHIFVFQICCILQKRMILSITIYFMFLYCRINVTFAI